MEEKVNKTTSSIGYNGKVSVHIVGTKNKLKKQYKVKNSGYQSLFRYLVTCLSGNPAESLCPVYVATYDLGEGGAESDFNTASVTCSRPIYKSSSVVTSDSETEKTELTFTIPGTSIVTGSHTNCLALYCSENYNTYYTDNRKPSAIVVLEDTIDVNSSETVVVIWELSVGNIEEGE